ncbi:hypothetical protein CIW83_09495 [Tissierella sp. P1]|uniref:hypothetical protein n=1 Tax=Tissierella sp. P1 TaxID=1280483 RepID=UPI000BA18E21|nr:hypothetical protein [Tissierella sp. P1]OZV12320.1 hypothetical protein CIW83_09495 [Tissierella sp. P1]
MNLSEGVITKALKDKHENLEDIFASQVKIGPAGSKIMDAVAIKKTWSPRTVIGYEIKISRQDFLSDQKHPVYMENCNIFYFVTPKGIIKDGELPVGVGHMIYNPETDKLRTSKKAPYRKQPINPDILLHIMFWKMDRYFGYRTRAEMLEDYKAKKELRSIGREIADKIWDLERQLDDLDRSYYKERYEELQKQWKEKFGTNYINFDEIPINDGLSTYDIQRLSQSAKTILDMTEKLKANSN